MVDMQEERPGNDQLEFPLKVQYSDVDLCNMLVPT